MQSQGAKDVPNTSDSDPNLRQMFSAAYDQGKTRGVKNDGYNFFS
jgi:hypothetical protein